MRGEMKMAISKEEVEHIAKLASLNLSEAEKVGYAKDMTEILEFANLINSVNTDSVNETIAANENYNVFKKDLSNNFYPKIGFKFFIYYSCI